MSEGKKFNKNDLPFWIAVCLLLITVVGMAMRAKQLSPVQVEAMMPKTPRQNEIIYELEVSLDAETKIFLCYGFPKSEWGSPTPMLRCNGYTLEEDIFILPGTPGVVTRNDFEKFKPQ